ncbi:MAG: GYD domain-containing protein [Chloroflexi bacterium]|nr:GYD domain-containing protein [Chloroflexota bacterium]
MPKLLVRAQYTQSGVDGMVREDAKRHGITLEALYWASGEDDLVAILDAPGGDIVVAYSLALGMTGTARQSTTPLLTAAEMDRAVSRMPPYRPPGR